MKEEANERKEGRKEGERDEKGTRRERGEGERTRGRG